MRGKNRGGVAAAALGKMLDALRAAIPGPAPILEPIPVRRPAARQERRR